MLRQLRRTWEDYGRRDPFFGVLSDPARHGGKWNEEEFFASGVAHVESLMRSLADARVAVPSGACLDFGCGVGRLTQALCSVFDRVTGVDVAASMIRRARDFNRHPDRCTYVVNHTEDLARFAGGSFAVVHSCIVLQHMAPGLAAKYLREFFRVVRPGGLVVFQLPAEPRRADESPAAFALPDGDYRAELALAAPLPAFAVGSRATAIVRVRNAGRSVWPETTPTGHAGRIMLGNHWLAPDGSVRVRDDGRAPLPRALWPGDEVEIPIVLTPPDAPGDHLLELDLVQELLCWFADKGSGTLRVPIAVSGQTGARHSALGTRDVPATRHQERVPNADGRVPTGRRSGLVAALATLLARFRPVAPPFEMHSIPRERVEALIAESGGRLVRAIEDDACGPGWRSYTYVCVRP
jgi:SAM-dependent methyltransferase